jgi:hypothetical protein
MALRYTVGGIIRGTAAEKSTVSASVPINTLYVETDTNIIYRYAGSSVWSQLSSSGGGASTFQPNKYYVYKDGSAIKARNGITGAVDFSSTDLGVVLDSIIGAISPAGTPTSIQLGEGDFALSTTFNNIIGSSIGNITIKGQGIGVTNLVLQTSITGTARGIDIAGTMGTAINLTVNASIGKNSVTVSTANAATFAVGDYVMLKSTALWDAVNGVASQGEIHRVTAVNTGTGVVSFREPLFDNYTTANTGNIAKLDMVQNITLQDFTIKPVDTGYTSLGTYLRFYLIDNLQLINVEMRDNVGESTTGIRLESCINSDLDVLCTRTDLYAYHPLPDEIGQYGVGIYSACQHVKVYARGRGIFRHVVSCGGISGVANSGIPRDITISGKAESGNNTAFDCHHDGEGIIFTDCSIIGSTHDDNTAYLGGLIQVRARNVTVSGCHARQGVLGVRVGEGAYNVSITGCTFHKIRSFTDGTSGYAIYVRPGVIGTVITGNQFADCPGLNVILSGAGANDTVITGNNFTNCKPLRFDSCFDVVVCGNRIKNGAERAIHMTGTSDRFVITGNNAQGSAVSTFTGAGTIRANNINLT